MLKRNSGFLLLVILLAILMYQVMLHITTNELDDRLIDLEQTTEYLQEQIDNMKGF